MIKRLSKFVDQEHWHATFAIDVELGHPCSVAASGIDDSVGVLYKGNYSQTEWNPTRSLVVVPPCSSPNCASGSSGGGPSS